MARRTISRVAMGLLAAIGIATLAWIHSGDSRGNARGSTYSLANVARGNVSHTVLTVGQLAPLIAVDISSQVSGLVTEVSADFNSPVKKGQVLALIDPATSRQRLRQAEADLAAAEAAQTFIQLRASRMRRLLQADLVTQDEYDEINAAARQGDSNLLTHRAALENARVDLERCKIVSPIDGIVIFRQIDVGQTVAASLSAPTLFTIAKDLTRMRIVAPINEVDVWSVKPGQLAHFTIDAIPDREFTGRVMQLRNPYTPTDRQAQQPSAPRARHFDAIIEVDNADLFLKPSLTANVSIVTETRENALLVPNTALRIKLPGDTVADTRSTPTRDRTTGFVYVVQPRDSASLPVGRRVSLGISDDFQTEITAGLREGEAVITAVAVPETAESRTVFGF